MNIRSTAIPYFQVLILFDRIPYFNEDNLLDHWEDYTDTKKDKFSKYEILSKDNPTGMVHVPEKMLIALLHIKNKPGRKKQVGNTTTKKSKISFEEYKEYYLAKIDEDNLITFSKGIKKTNFSELVVVNDFEGFIRKSACLIIGKQ